jgi:hypothetical protein
MPDNKKQILIKDIPSEYILPLKGKEYVQHPGLLAVAHANGLESLDSVIIDHDAERGMRYVVKAMAMGSRGSFAGHGEADLGSVKAGFSGSTLRMAETRAWNRALRCYLGLGITSLEELPPEPGQEAGSRSPSTAPAPAPAQMARTTGEHQIQNAIPTGQLPDCPWCGGRVWDNRDARANKENTRPAASCMNKECLGGSKNVKDPTGEWKLVDLGPWKQWDYDPSKWFVPRGCPPKGYAFADKNKWIDEQNGDAPKAPPKADKTMATDIANDGQNADDWNQSEMPF